MTNGRLNIVHMSIAKKATIIWNMIDLLSKFFEPYALWKLLAEKYNNL